MRKERACRGCPMTADAARILKEFDQIKNLKTM
nr:MAG TPA: NifU-like protein 1, chloroplast-sulfur cluster binding, program for [Caudoviricetes sp.]